MPPKKDEEKWQLALTRVDKRDNLIWLTGQWRNDDIPIRSCKKCCQKSCKNIQDILKAFVKAHLL